MKISFTPQQHNRITPQQPSFSSRPYDKAALQSNELTFGRRNKMQPLCPVGWNPEGLNIWAIRGSHGDDYNTDRLDFMA